MVSWCYFTNIIFHASVIIAGIRTLLFEPKIEGGIENEKNFDSCAISRSRSVVEENHGNYF